MESENSNFNILYDVNMRKSYFIDSVSSLTETPTLYILTDSHEEKEEGAIKNL